MKTEIIELRKIQADEGKILTNGETFSEVGGSVYLGINDKPENWREITEEEYNEVAENES